MMPIFRELADDRLDVLARYYTGEIPPEVYLGCYYAASLPRYDDTRGARRPAGDGSCGSGSKAFAMGRLRTEILMYYADAIEVLVRNRDFASEELQELERKALQIGFTLPYPVLPSYGNAVKGSARPKAILGRCSNDALDDLLALDIVGTCLQPVIHTPDSVVIANVGSWVSLVRLLAYATRSAAPAAARANALAELADWHLVSTPPGRRRFDAGGQRAIDLYARLLRELQQDDDLRAAATEIFSPEVPVVLPTYEPNPFAVAAAAESSRYVDVAFVVTKHGRAEEIEIIATSDDATRAEQRDVVQLIVGTTFRPRVVDGVLAAFAPVAVRYYLTPRSLEEARDVRLQPCERASVLLAVTVRVPPCAQRRGSLNASNSPAYCAPLIATTRYCSPFMHVGHRRAALRRRHVDGADLAARRLVVGAQHGADARPLVVVFKALAGDQQRLRHERARRAGLAGARRCQALSSGWFLMSSGVSPCAICQRISPRCHVDGADAAVRRLQQRQALHGQRELRRPARRIVGRQHAPLGRAELAAAAARGRARAARRARPRDGVAFDVRHLGLARDTAARRPC